MAKRRIKRTYPKLMIKTRGGVDQSKVINYELFQNRPRTRSLGNVNPVIVSDREAKVKSFQYDEDLKALVKKEDVIWRKHRVRYDPPPVPKTKHLSTQHIDETGKKLYVPSPKLLAIDASLMEREIQECLLGHEFWVSSHRHMGFTVWHYRVLQRGNPEVRFYFNGNKARIIKVFDEEITTETYSARVVYSNAYTVAEAENKFSRGKVFWAGAELVQKNK